MTASIASLLDLGPRDLGPREKPSALPAPATASRERKQPFGMTSAAPFKTGGSGGDLPLAVEFLLALAEAARRAAAPSPRAFCGVDALLLAGALLLAQPRRARVPIVDFAVQPRPHLALDLVDFDQAALLHLVEMLRARALAMA